MSVVLAFGLSPIGQGQAYAAEKADQPAAEEVLQTQAVNGAFGTLVIADNEGNTEATFTYDTKNQEVRVSAPDTGGSFIPTAGYKITYQEPGSSEWLDATANSEGGYYSFNVKAAGTYNIKATGLNVDVKPDGATTVKYYGKSTTGSVTVAKRDISGFIFVPATVGGTIVDASHVPTYTGADQAVTYRLAEVADAVDGGSGIVDYEKAEILAANYKGGKEANGLVTPNLEFGTDFDASAKIVTDAGEVSSRITALGSCTGTTGVGFEVAQASFIGANGYISNVSKSATSGLTKITAAAYANTYDTASIEVPANRAQSPVELKFDTGTTDASGKVYDTLVEKTDYTVKYYKTYNSTSGELSNEMTGTLPSTVSATEYYALVTFTGNGNFTNNTVTDSGNPAKKRSLLVTYRISKGGTIEKIADRAELPAATYLGGYAVTPATTGAKFYKANADGTEADVTDQVGANYEVGSGWAYAISNANTANTAKLSAGNAAIGAGTYTTHVTGKDAFTAETNEGAAVPATFTVEPRAAKKGTDAGDLKVTIKNVPFGNGSYISKADMIKDYITVEMYYEKDGGLVEIPSVEKKTDGSGDDYVGPMGSKVTNWTVSFTKDGKAVSAPSTSGTYEATFKFSGNLEGTPDITETFTVDKGDVTAKVKGIRAKDSKSGNVYTADPYLVYTGKALEVSKDDIVLVDAAGQEVTADDIAGADYTLTYEKDTATPNANGKPQAAGKYVLKATFSGTYEGTVEGTLDVQKLNLRKIVDQAYNAQLQYKQTDGSFDPDYSVAANADGSAIVPEVQVVVKSPKAGSDERVVVDPSVYTATFSNNTAAGKAAVTITSTDPSVTSSTAAQSGAFTITGTTFAAAGARIVLSKDYVPFASAASDPITLQVVGTDGPIAFNNGFLAGKADSVAVEGVEVWADKSDSSAQGIKFFKRTAPTYSSEIASENIVDSAYPTTVSEAVAGKYYINGASWVAEPGSSEWTSATVDYCETSGQAKTTKTVYKYSKDATTKYYTEKTAASYDEIDGPSVEWTKGSASETVNGTAYYAGTATLTFASPTVYKKQSDSAYYETTASETSIAEAKSFGGFTGTTATVAATGFTADTAKGTGYSLKVLDADGADVSDTAGFSITGESASPYATVTLAGLDKLGAGKYTVVAGAGSDGTYGGRITAAFEVGAIDIADSTKYKVLYTKDNRTTATTPVWLSLSDEWAVDYDAAQAKKTAGITPDYMTVGTNPVVKIGQIKIVDVAKTTSSSETTLTPWDEDTKTGDYKIEYENNKNAGEATMKIVGMGDYANTITKTYTINKVKIGAPTATASGYRVNFMPSTTLKYDKTLGKFRATYTGAAITPDYEVNLYPAANYDAENDTTKAAGMLEEGTYSVQWYNNEHVSYNYDSPIVATKATLLITAGGNYEGTIEGTFRIDPVDLSSAKDLEVSAADAAYTGEKVIPQVTVKANGTTFKQGTDFEVTSDNDGSVGEQTALVTSANAGDVTVASAIPVKFNIVKGDSKVTLAAKSFTYTGKAIAMSGAKVTGSKGAVTYKYYSDAKATKEISAPKNGGTYYAVATVAADDNYNGATSAAAKVTIKQAKNTKFKVTAKKKSYTAKRTANKAFKASALYKVTGKAGKVTYKKANTAGAKKIVVAKNGKVTVKKGLKAGTYKVKVKATSAANANYKAASKTVTIKVKVTKK